MDNDEGSSTAVVRTDEDLIEEFNKLSLYDSKMDTLFKVIFSNEDYINIAQSLIRSVIPIEENVENLKINNVELQDAPDRRELRVDVNASDKEGNIYIIEMQVSRIEDLEGRSVLTTSRIFNSFFKRGDKFINTAKKIYSINLLYYDLYPEDPDYYHYLFTHKLNNEKVCLPFIHYVYVELNKFKRKFTKEVLTKILGKNLLDKNIKIDRITERELWFLFLTSTTTVRNEPKKGIYKKFDREIEKEDKNGNLTKKRVTFYVRNDMNPDLYNIFKNLDPYNKALELSKTLPEEKESSYFNDTDAQLELAYKDEMLAHKDEEIASIKDDLARKEEELARKNEENKKMNEENKKMKEEIENLKRQLNNQNQDNNKKAKII